ncbi:hypothetical protein ACQRMY_001798, partial [Pseudomonas aeruginosa]
SGGESLTAEVRAGAATCAAGFGGLRFHKYRKKYDGKKYFSSSAGFFPQATKYLGAALREV